MPSKWCPCRPKIRKRATCTEPWASGFAGATIGLDAAWHRPSKNEEYAWIGAKILAADHAYSLVNLLGRHPDKPGAGWQAIASSVRQRPTVQLRACPVVVDGPPRHTQPLHAAKRGAGLVASLWVRVFRAPCLGALPLPGRRLVVPVGGLSRGARCVACAGAVWLAQCLYAYTKSKMLAVGLAYPFLSLVQARNDCRRAASSAS